MVMLGKLGEWQGPRSGMFEPSSLRVKDLAESRPVVDDKKPAVGTIGLAIGGGSRLPQMEKPLPVLRGEALEPNVRGEHARTIDEDASGLATMAAQATRPLRCPP
jgi:hypothetical protein